MKINLFFVIAAVVLFTYPLSVFADGDTAGMIQGQAVEVGNKICPVSGDKVGEMGDIVKYEYNGKIYNLCCKACIKDFKKDPEKYSKIAEDQVKAMGQEGMSGEEHMEDEEQGHMEHDHRY